MPRFRKTIVKAQPARRSVGVWIDHREAVLVFVSGEDKELIRIPSNVERHPGRSADEAPHAGIESRVRADDSHQRRFTGKLARFYEQVIGRIDGTAAVFILGPGEAKGELSRQLEKTGLAGRAVLVEAAERMTDGQLVRKVCKHFDGSSALVVEAPGAPHAHHQ